jgi:ABC-type multidrug transport system ATPase subunit
MEKMKISTQNLGKQFGREWIFKKFNVDFQTNQSYALIGNNGSGKSTLLKILAGAMPATVGEISYEENDKNIHTDNWFKYLAVAAPYLELIEEFSLQETIDFYIHFKKIYVKKEELIEKLGFSKNINKPIQFFSSGMKQKLKLGLAMYSDVKVLFLDEPTSNLDEKNTAWYLENIQEVLKDKITIICSNQLNEYHFCNQVINLTSFK